jgi:hypothetical protein
LQTWSTERQLDQQCPLAQMDTHITTTLEVDHDVIHHINWPLEDIGSCSMRYKSGIMVSVISIFEAVEFVTSITAFDYVTFAWTLCTLPCFALVVDLRPSKWVTLRDRYATGRSF